MVGRNSAIPPGADVWYRLCASMILQAVKDVQQESGFTCYDALFWVVDGDCSEWLSALGIFPKADLLEKAVSDDRQVSNITEK